MEHIQIKTAYVVSSALLILPMNLCQIQFHLLLIEWPVLLLSTESGRVDGCLRINVGRHDVDVGILVLLLLLLLLLGSESKSLVIAITLKRVARSLL
jgi:hypothetical protein